MKTPTANVRSALLGIALLAPVLCACGQGTRFFDFSNVIFRAPIHGPEPNDPSSQKWGNTPSALYPGTQTYAGAPLAGTNYSVEAWRSLMPAQNAFALQTGASSVSGSLRTFFTGPGAGFFNGGTLYSDYTYNPDQLPGQSQGVYLQVRCWDNAGGQYGTWDVAWNAAQAGGGNAVGWSKVFWQPVEFGLSPSPGMFNFESYNIFVVPEPGAVTLLALGGAAFFWRVRLRRRKRGSKRV